MRKQLTGEKDGLRAVPACMAGSVPGSHLRRSPGPMGSSQAVPCLREGSSAPNYPRTRRTPLPETASPFSAPKPEEGLGTCSCAASSGVLASGTLAHQPSPYTNSHTSHPAARDKMHETPVSHRMARSSCPPHGEDLAAAASLCTTATGLHN